MFSNFTIYSFIFLIIFVFSGTWSRHKCFPQPGPSLHVIASFLFLLSSVTFLGRPRFPFPAGVHLSAVLDWKYCHLSILRISPSIYVASLLFTVSWTIFLNNCLFEIVLVRILSLCSKTFYVEGRSHSEPLGAWTGHRFDIT